jgi:hypothetical protein
MESIVNERNAKESRVGMWVVLALTGALVAFLIGFLPLFIHTRNVTNQLLETKERLARAEDRTSEVEFTLELARLRGELGELLQTVNDDNYGTAASKASDFFDRVRAASTNEHAVAGSPRRDALDEVLARRDEISSGLARADAGVKTKLEELYMQFGAVTS